MHRFIIFLCLLNITASPASLSAADREFDRFLSGFDYEVRDDMKIDSKSLLPFLASSKGILIDVRFPEEVAAWRMGFAKSIPINELPNRIKELPKNKTIVVACPHKDRSAIAMAYLRSKGYDAKYLTDGLLGLAEHLRGEKAKDFLEALEKRTAEQDAKERGIK